VPTDVVNTSEYPALVKSVETSLNGEGLNLLINNAGLNVRPGGLNCLSEDIIMEHFRVNAVAPLMLVQVLQYFTPS